MDELIKAKRKNIILGSVSVIFALVGTVALALFSLEGVYAAVAIFAPITTFGYYGIPTFFTRAMRESVAISVLGAYETGVTKPKDISAATGLTEDAVEKSFRTLRQRKLIQLES